MRWIPFAIFAYVLVVLQATLGRILTIHLGGVGHVGPDLLAVLGLMLVLYLRSGTDAALAAGLLGLALDLTTAGGPGGATVVGPMALGYAAAAWVVFQVREAFFRERLTTRFLLTLLFCLIAHGLWVTLQSVRFLGDGSWAAYGASLLQAVVNSVYTALLAPLVMVGLDRVRRWMIVAPADRRGRSR